MYFNVISFKNGKTIQFKSETPYGADKVVVPDMTDLFKDWNVISDDVTGQTLTFRGSEVTTIVTGKITEEPKTTK